MIPAETLATADPPRPSILDVDRDVLLERFRAVRRASLWLAEPLAPEDMVVQSMPDASPTKWHLAHTTWFFEVMVLRSARPETLWFCEDFHFLFNSYYNTLGKQFERARRGLVTRPTVEETLRYRAHIDTAVVSLLETASPQELERWAPVVEVGLQHEQQHQELLLTDIKHLLAQNPLHPIYRPRLGSTASDGTQAAPLRWQRFPKGLYQVGHDGEGFAFDNEGPRHQSFLHGFEIAERPVTCGEYLDFIEDGGYQDPQFWLSEGWATVQREGWQAPLYWQHEDSRWWQLTLTGRRPVGTAEPVVHTSLFEADAYARWAGARLPTEEEWEVAAAHGKDEKGHFVEDGHFHPRPLEAADGAGFLGHVWEWTASSYSPYPGYRPPEGALGEYNGKFMCNQYVLRGGSCATPRSHIRLTYRNFFPAGARWQFMGLRLAKDAT